MRRPGPEGLHMRRPPTRRSPEHRASPGAVGYWVLHPRISSLSFPAGAGAREGQKRPHFSEEGASSLLTPGQQRQAWNPGLQPDPVLRAKPSRIPRPSVHPLVSAGGVSTCQTRLHGLGSLLGGTDASRLRIPPHPCVAPLHLRWLGREPCAFGERVPPGTQPQGTE